MKGNRAATGVDVLSRTLPFLESKFKRIAADDEGVESVTLDCAREGNSVYSLGSRRPQFMLFGFSLTSVISIKVGVNLNEHFSGTILSLTRTNSFSDLSDVSPCATRNDSSLKLQPMIKSTVVGKPVDVPRVKDGREIRLGEENLTIVRLLDVDVQSELLARLVVVGFQGFDGQVVLLLIDHGHVVVSKSVAFGRDRR